LPLEAGIGQAPAQFGERGFRANPIRIVAGKEEHLGGRAGPDPGHLDQLGRGLFCQLLQVDIVGLDLFIKGQPTSGE